MSKAKDYIPPIIVNLLIGMGFAGNRFSYGYATWAKAQAKCSGYDSDEITQVLVRASRRVRDGEVAYERDGVEFDSIQYSWPLLAAILGTPRSDSRLRVLDWGGSLGSTYRQNKDLLSAAGIELEWVIVEQPHLVEIGTREFSDSNLSFRTDLKSIPEGYFDFALFASSICYVENPRKVISDIMNLGPKRMVFDRTPESRSNSDQIGVQRVGRGIYRASYPIRSFAPQYLNDLLSPRYKMQFDWISELQPDPKTVSKGYCFDLL
jgi:putative methyltransferase (TIGR04325 family)